MFFLGNDSIYAGKTAAATTVFAILIYANTTRPWFISYGLTGGLITVVVALAPTLGEFFSKLRRIRLSSIQLD